MKPQVFKDQTGVKLRLQSFLDFDENPVTSAKIKFIKPDGTAGEWTAQVLPGALDGDIYVDFSAAEKFDQAGRWSLWLEVVYTDGRTGKGRKTSYYVED